MDFFHIVVILSQGRYATVRPSKVVKPMLSGILEDFTLEYGMDVSPKRPSASLSHNGDLQGLVVNEDRVFDGYY